VEIKTLIERCAKGRIACLKDNEEPRDLLISRSLKNQIRREAEPFMAYMQDGEWDRIMGMRVEWVNADPSDISIRTVNGDVRIVP
jgi:hypothetical protein